MTYKNYKIKKKEIYLNYIKFELDGDVGFSNGNHNFIFCTNEYPFKNYRVGEEIEVNLTNAKFMSSQNYHQGIIRQTSRSYSGGYYGGLQHEDYDLSRNEEEEEQKQQLLMQKQKTLHQVKLALDSFYNVLEPLEEYVEKTGCYSNFRNRRQLYRRVIQDSEGTLESDKNLFLTDLYIFSGAVEEEADFIMEVLKEDFYRWINHTGITAENCPKRLKHFLIEINNVLEGNDEKIVRETDERDKVRAKKPDLGKLVEIFSGLQQPLNRNRDQRKELGNRSWNELDDKDRLKGDADLGREAFERIERSVSNSHGNFQLWQRMGEEDATVMEGIESSNSSASLGQDNSQYQAVQEQPTQPPQGRWAWVNGGWLWTPSK